MRIWTGCVGREAKLAGLGSALRSGCRSMQEYTEGWVIYSERVIGDDLNSSKMKFHLSLSSCRAISELQSSLVRNAEASE